MSSFLKGLAELEEAVSSLSEMTKQYSFDPNDPADISRAIAQAHMEIDQRTAKFIRSEAARSYIISYKDIVRSQIIEAAQSARMSKE